MTAACRGLNVLALNQPMSYPRSCSQLALPWGKRALRKHDTRSHLLVDVPAELVHKILERHLPVGVLVLQKKPP